MSIPGNAGSPYDRPAAWATLSAAAKRERLLSAAAEVFTARGIDAPMPDVAAAAGAGIASVYRQFPSKQDLLAALAVRRLDQLADDAEQAGGTTGDRFEALTGLLWGAIERQSLDDFMSQAWLQVREHADVTRASERASTAVAALLDDAREEGRLRPDASWLDVRLLFAATRAAKTIEPTAWRRTLELFIDALRREPGDD